MLSQCHSPVYIYLSSENNLEDDEEDSINGNKCHLCMKQLDTKYDLYQHMEVYHEDFYQGIMEAAKAMSHPAGEKGVSKAQGLAGLANKIMYK